MMLTVPECIKTLRQGKTIIWLVRKLSQFRSQREPRALYHLAYPSNPASLSPCDPPRHSARADGRGWGRRSNQGKLHQMSQSSPSQPRNQSEASERETVLFRHVGDVIETIWWRRCRMNDTVPDDTMSEWYCDSVLTYCEKREALEGMHTVCREFVKINVCSMFPLSTQSGCGFRSAQPFAHPSVNAWPRDEALYG